MINSLNNLPTPVSNWKNHPQGVQWLLVDWAGHFFQRNSHLIPQGEKGCCMYPIDTAPANIQGRSVHILSTIPIELTSMDFPSNFWGVGGVKQCDGLIFPTSNQQYEALLFVETKYSQNVKAWKKYKKHALKQITDTISELSNRGCPIHQRKLYGVISCPLLNSMGASVFSPKQLIEIYRNYNLEVHMGNTATFQDAQNISFTK